MHDSSEKICELCALTDWLFMVYNENGRKERFRNPFLYNGYYYDTETGFY